jgi:predicted dehydrogenase
MMHFVVIGLGSIGRRHLVNLAELVPTARLTVVRHEGRADDLCDRLGARVVSSLAEVPDDVVDLAVLATPSANHVEALPGLIASGWPLLIEKPIVTDLASVELVESHLTQAPPAVRAAGFNLRHLPSIRRMKRHLDRGDLGQIVRASFVAGQWLPDWRPGVDYRAGYSASERRGGGVELDLSHEVDLARWFFGELRLEFAASGRFSSLEIDSNDTATAVFVPTDSPAPLVTVTLDYVSRRRVRAYEIVGDEGTLSWNVEGDLQLTTSTDRRSLVDDPIDHDVACSYLGLVESVLSASRGELTAPVQSLEDGLRSTRLAIEVRDRGGHR